MVLKLKIDELDTGDKVKIVLKSLIGNRRTIADIAALLNCEYNTASQKVRVWLAKNWLVRHQNKGKVFYITNTAMLE